MKIVVKQNKVKTVYGRSSRARLNFRKSDIKPLIVFLNAKPKADRSLIGNQIWLKISSPSIMPRLAACPDPNQRPMQPYYHPYSLTPVWVGGGGGGGWQSSSMSGSDSATPSPGSSQTNGKRNKKLS